ncbi:hypothetical protein FRB90_006465 [Tulasnella sp. 427]|nr:hypothetical protein FRB90_006465 [Tulasnella sp. 427]
MLLEKSLSYLPFDIFIDILQFASPCTLRSVILAARELQKVAEPILYRHIDLSNCFNRSSYLLRTLVARNELCRHICTFVAADQPPEPGILRYSVQRIFRRENDWPETLSAYTQIIGILVEEMTNVELLSIPDLGDPPVRVLAQLPNLKRLRSPAVYTYLRGGSETLLEAAPNLTHLELPYNTEFIGSKIRSDVVPSLEELSCKLDNAALLVPGRPVQRLVLRWPQSRRDHITEIMQEIARGTETITELGLYFRKWDDLRDNPRDVIKATSKWLPDVEDLSVWVKSSNSNDDIYKLEQFLLGVSKHLSEFRKLRVLDFSGCEGYGVSYSEHFRDSRSSAHRDILRRWSNTCPTLNTVYATYGDA